MPDTIGEVVDQLINELTEDHANKDIPDKEKNRALSEDNYLDCLIELQNYPVDYATTIRAIAEAAKLNVTDIKKQIKARVEEKANTTDPNTSEKPKPAPEITNRAMRILREEGLVLARRKQIAKKHQGDDAATDLYTYTGNSAYIDDPMHVDITGDPEIGKTDLAFQSLRLYPLEDILFFTEISPKYVYYESKKTNFKNKLMYVDDAGQQHIGIIKVLRNETDIPVKSGTVGDKDSLNLQIDGHPVVYVSSVFPLRDSGGQCTSRAFLAPLEKPTDDEEKKVHETIRRKTARKDIEEIFKKLGKSEDETEERAIQEAERYLRDNGVLRIGIPFDAREPDNIGRRDTGKFIKVIKTSAFIHQLKRPILHIGDDKVVLAIQEDILNALKLYHDLGLGHALRVTPNGLTILKVLSDKESEALAASGIRTKTGLKDRTIQDNLRDLFDGDLVHRKQISAPGIPFAYWIDSELREKILNHAKEQSAQISDTGGIEDESRGITRKFDSRKYAIKYSSDCLKSSIYSFFNEFSNKNIECIWMEYFGQKVEGIENIISLYIGIFAAQLEKESRDIDESRESRFAQFAQMPDDSENEIRVNVGEMANVAKENPSMDVNQQKVNNHCGNSILKVDSEEISNTKMPGIPVQNSLINVEKRVRWTEDQPPIDRDCGSCQAAVTGDTSAIKCEPCYYRAKAEI